MKYLGLFPDVPDLQGCSDGGCVFRPPTGMHTNGGCACMKRGADPLRLQLNLQRISRHMESMRAELGAQRARANENELCAAAVVEIRRICAEIMGGNMAFVDDAFARCLLPLRDELDALAKENAALRALLVECRPSMVEHRKRVEQDLTNAAYFPGRYPETLKALNTERDICDALLDRIDAAIGAER